MSPATVKLLVIENIMLQPAMDVYILPFCTVHYTVERKKQVLLHVYTCRLYCVWSWDEMCCPLQGKTEVVAMPSDQYSLELTNTTVASLDIQTSNVTGMVIGDTEVVLQDKSIQHCPELQIPLCSHDSTQQPHSVSL